MLERFPLSQDESIVHFRPILFSKISRRNLLAHGFDQELAARDERGIGILDHTPILGRVFEVAERAE